MVLPGMVFLWIVGSVIILRALIGWEVQVSKARVLPKSRARILALALLPIFSLGNEPGLLSVAFLFYMTAFAIIGCLLSVERVA